MESSLKVINGTWGNSEKNIVLPPLQSKLIETLEENGALHRQELVKIVERPRTTIYDNLSILEAHGIISKYPRPTTKQGRPHVYYKIEPIDYNLTTL